MEGKQLQVNISIEKVVGVLFTRQKSKNHSWNCIAFPNILKTTQDTLIQYPGRQGSLFLDVCPTQNEFDHIGYPTQGRNAFSL